MWTVYIENTMEFDFIKTEHKSNNKRSQLIYIAWHFEYDNVMYAGEYKIILLI